MFKGSLVLTADEAANRGPWAAIEGPQIDSLGRATGQRTHRNQCLALSAQSIVGVSSIGMRLDCRSFHAAMRRPASSSAISGLGRALGGRFLLGRRAALPSFGD